MEKTFQVRAPNGQLKEVTETLAKQLGRQVEVIGEVVGTKFKRRDREESISIEEYREKHIHSETLPDGSKVRRIDPGFERISEIDKESKPGQAQFSGGAYRSRKIKVGGREIPYEDWLKIR